MIVVAIRWGAVLLVTAAIGTIDVEHIKAIADGWSSLLDTLCAYGLRHEGLCWERNIAFIPEELDFAAFVGRATHHASSGEECVVNAVHGDVGIAATEYDVDDHKVVNVLHIVADSFFRETFLDSRMDDDVASGAIGNLVRDMIVEVELAVCPLHFDLESC